MRVKILKTSEFREVNDSYAARLVEQGRAIPAPAEAKPAAAPAARKSTAKARKEKAAGKG